MLCSFDEILAGLTRIVDTRRLHKTRLPCAHTINNVVGDLKNKSKSFSVIRKTLQLKRVSSANSRGSQNTSSKKSTGFVEVKKFYFCQFNVFVSKENIGRLATNHTAGPG